MRRFLLALAILCGIAGPASAGRNAYGSMVLHTDDAIIYSSGWDYCTNYPLPATCAEFNTTTNRLPDAEAAAIWVVGVWPAGSSPGFTAYQFGVYGNYPSGYWEWFTPCGPGALEIPDATWPESGTGTAVAYTSAVYPIGPVKLYFLEMYGIVGGEFSTGHYPHGPMYAQFADDSNPPIVDNCYNFGTVRWGAPGQNVCPPPPIFGACCFPNGSCQEMLQPDCLAMGGEYMGDHVPCTPDPCPPPLGACCFADCRCEILTEPDCTSAGGIFTGYGTTCIPNPCPCPIGACCLPDGTCMEVVEAECLAQGGFFLMDVPCSPNPCPQLGACCFPDGSCLELTEADCAAQGGGYQGDHVPCTPELCPAVPVDRTTWGRIKSDYR